VVIGASQWGAPIFLEDPPEVGRNPSR
jgi:hypothetical protein